ncbi:hypothetical protein ACIBJI_35420 [Nocardia sp. NPDC050408]|uniref:hypothetical protein n=1 Tax=Nocardia sp. NPDC050408 TaxID=3364319 RepID=UPI0037B38348
MMNSRFALALSVPVLATLVGIPLAGPANADDVLLTCTEKGTVNWLGAGIGDSPAKVGWTDTITFSNCTGPAIDQGLPYPVSETDAGTETASCSQPTTDNESTGTIVWSDGSTTAVSSGSSEIEADGSRSGEFPTLISTGPYKGKTATDTNTVTPAIGSSIATPFGQLCLGVTSATLEGTFTITK